MLCQTCSNALGVMVYHTASETCAERLIAHIADLNTELEEVYQEQEKTIRQTIRIIKPVLPKIASAIDFCRRVNAWLGPLANDTLSDHGLALDGVGTELEDLVENLNESLEEITGLSEEETATSVTKKAS